MLKTVAKVHIISPVLNKSLRVFLLLSYFIVITSPNTYVVTNNNAKVSVVYKTKLTKDASPYSTIAHLNTPSPNGLSGSTKDNDFVKLPMLSGRNILSLQPPSPLVSSNAEFPNATKVRNSSRKPNKFLNAGAMDNLTDLHISEHYVNIRNAKSSNYGSDSEHPSILGSLSSASSISNLSNQPSFSTSQSFETNSSVISVSSSTLDISFNSSNNTLVDTVINNFTSFVIHPSRETTTVDSASSDSQGKGLTSGAIAGIVIVVIAIVIVLTGTVIYLLYQRCGKNNKLESKCPSDNCGYVDDTLRSSGYLNSHIELPKENSEEMTSLDNDSFLNSLESMTFQNYWADNTKNTKV